MTNNLEGRRLHIAGSIPKKPDQKSAEYSQSLVKTITTAVLSNAGGLVITVGPEPILEGTNIPAIFDWTILEAVDQFYSSPIKNWPNSQGRPIVALAFEKNIDKIPEHRKELWKRLMTKNIVDLQPVCSELSVGGIMRQEQSKYGDILLTIGGYLGVYHLVQLYQVSKKPVIPLNLPFSEGTTASEILSHHATIDPKDFFDYSPSTSARTAYTQLSLKGALVSEGSYCQNLFNFINHLPKPSAFYVRLLDSKNPDFQSVEKYFRNVVDEVIPKMGYTPFEMSRDFSEEIFMNVALFERLHHSSLVIVDLTGVRPNCCLELGFALGLGKKFILLARDGTNIPWDTSSIQCHFWKKRAQDDKRTKDLKGFIEKNINKNPIC